jgi:YhcH/YjgK/YiaL family protein
MIIGHLSNIRQEVLLYPRGLQEGFQFLLETDLSSLPLGRHEIKGGSLYAMVLEYETQPKAERRPEAHRKYIDIQYICSGREMIGSGPVTTASEVDEDCLEARDVIFYKGLAAETEVVLTPGMFAVYFPWDAHRPNCNAGEARSKMRKVVVKVAMDTLV